MNTQLSDETHVGGVRLQVGDLDRSMAFYRDLLGFAELSRSGRNAELGVNGERPLVTLVERRGARPVRPHGRLGLFHFAILLPSRAALGSMLMHLNRQRVLLGMSDHLVSEALYLSDPDGLGLEIYRDRPRAEWPRHGNDLAMATDPLDVEGVMSEPGVGTWTGMPVGTTIGHMHLHVGDLAAAEEFYCRVIGFDVTVRRYPGALFMSAGGYHHHLGVNTWARGADAPGPDEAQLLHWELVARDADEVAEISGRVSAGGAAVTPDGATGFVTRDPFGTAVRVVAR